jgi:hypothetical protein
MLGGLGDTYEVTEAGGDVVTPVPTKALTGNAQRHQRP